MKQILETNSKFIIKNSDEMGKYKSSFQTPLKEQKNTLTSWRSAVFENGMFLS